MLMGEYRHNIDDKGRLIIPSKFREELGDSFIVTKGLENCLFIYSLSNWEKIVSKLKSLPFTKKDVRTFTRFFLASACNLEFDKQGRINIPNNLLEYANIQKECVVIGVLDRLEIWNQTAYQGTILDNYDSFSDIAENLFEGGFNDAT
jgi:MraZ protein